MDEEVEEDARRRIECHERALFYFISFYFILFFLIFLKGKMKGETCLCRASSSCVGWRVINSRLETSISQAFPPFPFIFISLFYFFSFFSVSFCVFFCVFSSFFFIFSFILLPTGTLMEYGILLGFQTILSDSSRRPEAAFRVFLMSSLCVLGCFKILSWILSHSPRSVNWFISAGS